MKNIFTVFILLVSGCAFSAESLKANPVSSWLSSHSDYRLAKFSDCACEKLPLDDSKKAISTENPYQAEGDFDGDGIKDLAVVVIDKNDLNNFLILVFASRFSNGKNPIAYSNIFVDEPLSHNGLSSKAYKNKTILLYGGFYTEAEAIDIPAQLPK